MAWIPMEAVLKPLLRGLFSAANHTLTLPDKFAEPDLAWLDEKINRFIAMEPDERVLKDFLSIRKIVLYILFHDEAYRLRMRALIKILRSPPSAPPLTSVEKAWLKENFPALEEK